MARGDQICVPSADKRVGTSLDEGRSHPVADPIQTRRYSLGGAMTPARVEVSRPEKMLWPGLGLAKQVYVDYLEGGGRADAPMAARSPADPGASARRRRRQALLPEGHPVVRAAVEPHGHHRGSERQARRRLRPVQRRLDAGMAREPGRVGVPPGAGPRLDRLDGPTCWSSTSTRPTTRSTPPSGSRSWCWRSSSISGLEPGEDDRRQGPAHRGPDRAAGAAGAAPSAAAALTTMVAGREPDLVTDEFRKAKRAGRVMLDPSRNGVGATVVAAYSPRGPGPTARCRSPCSPRTCGRSRPATSRSRRSRKLLKGAAPKRWTEAADGPRQRLPASLLSE